MRRGALAEWTVSASLGWQQLEQDAKRDGESTPAAKNRARLGEVCLRLSQGRRLLGAEAELEKLFQSPAEDIVVRLVEKKRASAFWGAARHTEVDAVLQPRLVLRRESSPTQSLAQARARPEFCVAVPTNRDKVRAHDLTEFARLTSLHLASMRRASCGYKHAPETEGQSHWLRPSVSFSRSSDRGKL